MRLQSARRQRSCALAVAGPAGIDEIFAETAIEDGTSNADHRVSLSPGYRFAYGSVMDCFADFFPPTLAVFFLDAEH